VNGKGKPLKRPRSTERRSVASVAIPTATRLRSRDVEIEVISEQISSARSGGAPGKALDRPLSDLVLPQALPRGIFEVFCLQHQANKNPHCGAFVK
jgi:hypothetical protein